MKIFFVSIFCDCVKWAFIKHSLTRKNLNIDRKEIVLKSFEAAYLCQRIRRTSGVNLKIVIIPSVILQIWKHGETFLAWSSAHHSHLCNLLCSMSHLVVSDNSMAAKIKNWYLGNKRRNKNSSKRSCWVWRSDFWGINYDSILYNMNQYEILPHDPLFMIW